MAGIYIHIPFCKKACNYCNFHFSTQLELKDALIESLRKEISLQKDFIPANELIETIYFGGGTPSVLTVKEIQLLIDTVRQNYSVSQNPEITLEANPGSVEQQRFTDYRALGINRLSLGIQSFNAVHLKALGRIHDDKQAHCAIESARNAGFDNINIDIISIYTICTEFISS